ncbi:anthranilate synthase component II [Frigidibacter mobilis]|uniref:Anthranilate synthase component II n=1 Tax=Frigidibacter mobilis TaxID=1335048 RepID=A0A159Z3E8_9RHOB|nr:anthranilate synthase component II [Frigidibacter mobilis]
MLLLIDNYDSFTYNLVHYLGELGAEVLVRRNDALDVQQAMALNPSAIVLSPGPCDPAQAGICLALTAAAAETRTPLGGVPRPSDHRRGLWRQGDPRAADRAWQDGQRGA